MGLQEGWSALISTALILAAFSQPAMAERQRKPRESVELVPKDRRALSQLQLAISDASVPGAETLSVTDLLLVIIKRGGDVAAALGQSDGTAAPANEPAFTARLFTVAGGRLYSDARARCGPWENGVARCSLSCDGGTFALRRQGTDSFTFLIGAIPGGPADGAKQGVSLSACDIESNSETRLVPASGRGLAEIGLIGAEETN